MGSGTGSCGLWPGARLSCVLRHGARSPHLFRGFGLGSPVCARDQNFQRQKSVMSFCHFCHFCHFYHVCHSCHSVMLFGIFFDSQEIWFARIRRNFPVIFVIVVISVILVILCLDLQLFVKRAWRNDLFFTWLLSCTPTLVQSKFGISDLGPEQVWNFTLVER